MTIIKEVNNMGKLVELAKIHEELEANQEAILKNREDMIAVLKGQLKVANLKIELLEENVKDLEEVISLYEKDKDKDKEGAG